MIFLTRLAIETRGLAVGRAADARRLIVYPSQGRTPERQLSQGAEAGFGGVREGLGWTAAGGPAGFTVFGSCVALTASTRTLRGSQRIVTATPGPKR